MNQKHFARDWAEARNKDFRKLPALILATAAELTDCNMLGPPEEWKESSLIERYDAWFTGVLRAFRRKATPLLGEGAEGDLQVRFWKRRSPTDRRYEGDDWNNPSNYLWAFAVRTTLTCNPAERTPCVTVEAFAGNCITFGQSTYYMDWWNLVPKLLTLESYERVPHGTPSNPLGLLHRALIRKARANQNLGLLPARFFQKVQMPRKTLRTPTEG